MSKTKQELLDGAMARRCLIAPVKTMAEVYEIERLHAELGSNTDADRQRKLEVLDQAAGLFRATSAFVRVSP